jgi:hypothetical protein
LEEKKAHGDKGGKTVEKLPKGSDLLGFLIPGPGSSDQEDR